MLATKLDHRAVATAGHDAMESNVSGARGNGSIGLPHARGTERGEVA